MFSILVVRLFFFSDFVQGSLRGFLAECWEHLLCSVLAVGNASRMSWLSLKRLDLKTLCNHLITVVKGEKDLFFVEA